MIILKLVDKLKSIFKMDQRNIVTLAIIIMAIIKNRSVNLASLVHCLDSKTRIESRYKKLQRFIWNVRFDRKALARFLISFAGKQERYMIAIDRTNRNYGKFKINILVLWVVYKWMAIPILWKLLDKKWNSSSKERIELLIEYIEVFWKGSIWLVLWDREFIWHERVNRLIGMHIEFWLRVRNNTIVEWYGKRKHIRESFKHDQYYIPRSLKRARNIWWLRLFVTGMKVKDEYLIVVSKSYDPKILEKYWDRWEIETLFWDMKSRWFNFEDTHLQKQERINAMMWILAICVVRAHTVWEWRTKEEPIKVKQHWRKQYSIFRYGLELIKDGLNRK